MTVAMATVSLFFTSCDDKLSDIGNSLTSSNVQINIDSLTYALNARTIEAPSLESRSSYMLLGSISVPEYGDLNCSYVTQFLPSETINIPDTISGENVDSVKMIFTIPKRYITGDTLAPKQLKVFELTKQLPGDITPDFNPDGYYESGSPMAVKNYTLSGYTFNDSTFISSSYANVYANLPVQLGSNVLDAYETNPDVFVWPQEFAKYFPGVYVAPTFGKGCIAAVQNTSVYVYFPKTTTATEEDADGNMQIVHKTVADSVCVFTSAPEVLSSINIDYKPSDKLKSQIGEGKSVITTPGGYTVSFEFPVKDILEEYWKEEYDLGVINNMVFSIPAKIISNAYGLGLPPAMLMVKSSEVEEFFSEGKLPDNMSSFYSLFSSDDMAYTFSSMRQYIVDMKNKGEGNITADDVEFTLIPVSVTTEQYTDSSYNNAIAVTDVVPFTIMPTLTELDTQHAKIVFTYSNETLE